MKGGLGLVVLFGGLLEFLTCVVRLDGLVLGVVVPVDLVVL